MLVILQQS